MPYPNNNPYNIVISQTSGSSVNGQYPFVETIISGSNLFIVTGANGLLTASTFSPTSSVAISASYALTASFSQTTLNTISASYALTSSFSQTASVSLLSDVSSINTGSTHYVTFVDGTTGVRQLKTDADVLSYIPSTNTLAVGTSASGSITVGAKVTLQDLGGTSQLRVGITTTDTASLLVSSNAFQVIKGQGPGVDKVFTNLELSASNNVLFSNTTQATDWLTGALNVVGGVGIGKNLYVSGSLNAIGTVVLGDTITDTIQITGSTLLTGSFSVAGASTFSGLVSASAGLTASAIQDVGPLTVVGNSILSTVFATNVTASNISASGNISASTLRVETSTVDGGTLTVLGNTVLGDAITDTTRITGSTSISGSLTVVGNTTLQSTFVTNLTASNISASSITSSVLLPISSSLKFNGSNISTYASSSTLGYFDSGNYGDFLIQSNDVPRVRIGGSTGNITFNNTNGNSVLLLTTLTASLYNEVTITASGSVVMSGDLAVNGGDITTTSATATLFNTNASNVNIGGGAVTQVLLGSTVGIVKTAGDFRLGVNNIIQDTSGATGLTVSSALTTVAGDLQVNGNDIKDSSGNNNLTLSSTRVNVPLTLQPTDWTNGALTVAGGVGIGKNLHVSGSTFLYGDLTIYGTGSVVNISSSTVIIGDNRIQLNAGVPIQRYAGIDVFDSGSGAFTNNVTSSLLWDGLNDNWLLVSNNQLTGSPLTQSSAIIIGGPSGSFGVESLLTVNYIPKVQSTGKNLQNSSLIDTGTVLAYAGTGISASQITASQLIVQYTGSITYATGVYITYTTGSFTTITITTGSNPGVGSQVPATPTASGMAGQINVDNNFIYVYTNQIWKRVPLSTWSV